MLQGVGSNAALNQAINPANTAMGAGSASTNAGTPSGTKDATESSTAPKLGEVLEQIQARFGARPEKAREIKKTLGKDDFLRIMLTQMRHQDPTNPFKPEQMAAEMAQFTSVEQLQNVNQNLAKMSNQNQPLERLAMVGMIGKTVTIDRERFPHTEGTNDSLSFTLPKNAKDVKVAILAESGEAVFEKDLGAQKAGEQSFSWDGAKVNTLPAKSGTYMLRVTAVDDNGQSVQSNPLGQAKIVGVSFEGGEPVFLIGNAQHQDKVTLRNIVRVESEPLAGGAAAAAPSFVAFQKGAGSSTVPSPAALPPDAAEALRRYEASQGAGPAAAPAQPTVVARAPEKGFPNGLQDEQSSQTRGGETK